MGWWGKRARLLHLDEGSGGTLLILAYHRVNREVRDGISVSPDTLAEELRHLIDRGWRNVVLDESLDDLARLRAEKAFAITFDDGYQDNYLHAAPVLEELGLRATVYLVSSYIDSNTPFPWIKPHGPGNEFDDEDLHMTTAQLEDALSRGVFRYGSHTRTHPMLPGLSRDQASDEIEGSKEALEQQLGIRVRTFCYPAGAFTDETVSLVSGAGYDAAVVTPNRAIPETEHTLHRVGIYSHVTPNLFKLKTHPLVTRSQHHETFWRMRRLLGKLRPARVRG